MKKFEKNFYSCYLCTKNVLDHLFIKQKSLFVYLFLRMIITHKPLYRLVSNYHRITRQKGIESLLQTLIFLTLYLVVDFSPNYEFC